MTDGQHEGERQDNATWTIDAPGQWAVDRSHMPGGATPLIQAIQTKAMPAGMRRVMRDLGVPVDTLDARFVNGFFYSRLRPLISPDKPPTKLPPAFVLKLATRLHPEMRRRAKKAAHTLETEPWTKVIHEWQNGGRAKVEAENLALQDVDLDGLDDAALVAHVRRVVDHCEEKWELHFWLHGFDLGPLGRFLWQVMQWGFEASELLPLLEGASPSTSAPMKALRRIRDEVESAVKAGGREPNSLDEMRAISPSIAAAIDEYLRYRGHVLFSRYDVDGVTLGERPDLVFATIMSADPRDVEARTVAIRARVPAEHRVEFDEVLRQARSAMDLRDDNGPTTAEWPLGLLRHALLALGKRMVDRGRATAPAAALELRLDELTPALLDADSAGGPTAAELSARAAERRRLSQLTPPETIGPAELAPPVDVLPPALGQMVGMVQTVIAQLGMDGAERTSGLHGAGIGTEVVRGRACVAASPEEALDLLEPGDILVVACTTPAYNLVLSLASGVVTSEGGPMSHAAVLARELGIPAVIGAKGAVLTIEHGSQIEVDPRAGEVRVLAIS